MNNSEGNQGNSLTLSPVWKTYRKFVVVGYIIAAKRTEWVKCVPSDSIRS